MIMPLFLLLVYLYLLCRIVRAVNEALKRSALAPVVAAAALPLALLEAASGLVSYLFVLISSLLGFFALFVVRGGGKPG